MGGALEDFVLLQGVGREDFSVAYNFEFFPRHGRIWNSRFWSRWSSGFRSRRTALEPYRPYFAAVAIGCISYGFYRVYRKPAAACHDGSYCAKPASNRIAKIGLWSATVMIVIALVSPYVIAQWL